ncbi:hypothetical protein K439DRAFT_1365698, partial [Ramaria rubella]
SKHEQVSMRHQAWEAQMPALFRAYIIYKYGPVPDPPNVINAKFFEMSVLGTQGYDVAQLLPRNQCHDHLNESLIMHGLLGTVPVHPTLAIPIMTLELYLLLCHKPKSIGQINYHQAIRDQFSDAFDTYLAILCQVNQAINVQLNRNTGSL